MTTLVTEGKKDRSDGETERQRDRETERQRDGETERFCRSLSATTSPSPSIPPSLRLSVSPSLRLSVPLPCGAAERRVWKQPLVGPVDFIINNRPPRQSGSGQH